MMIYDFEDTATGEKVTYIMSLAEYEAAKICGDCIYHDGRTLARVYSAKSTANDTKFKPIISESMGGHPDQREEFIAEAIKRGVPTEITEDCCPVLTSEAHKRRYMKAFGFHEKNTYC